MEITNSMLYRALVHRAERESEQLRMACRANAKLNKQFEDLQTCYCPRTGEIVLSDKEGNVQEYIKELNAQRKTNRSGNVVAPAGKEDENGLR